MATAVVAPTPVPGWQEEAALEAASLCAKVLVEQEKENSKNTNIEDECNGPKNEDKPKPKVEPITEWQKKQFEIWMEKNKFNMYPSRDEKEKLAEMLDATYLQITRLFANHRRRFLKKKPTTSQTEVKEGSIDRLMTFIKEPSDCLIHDETSTSERSISPIIRFDDGASETDDSLAAICGAVADQIHDDIENKQKNINSGEIQKKKRKPRQKKRKISDREAKLETTVDEILSKVSKEEIEKGEKEETSLTEAGDRSMTSTLVDSGTISNLNEMNHNHLLSLVNEVIAQPPTAIPQSVMADVNPRLLEAMDLLNKGVSWTHPAILSVLLEILRQQQEQQTRLNILTQLSQQHNCSPVSNCPETSPPPGCESVNSGFSEKSTEELMRSLTPDEYLAVNVLTELADSC